MKILQPDKVFFQFFENILNGQGDVIVCRGPRFLPFYRISTPLPRKKLKNFWVFFGPLRRAKMAANRRAEDRHTWLLTFGIEIRAIQIWAGN